MQNAKIMFLFCSVFSFLPNERTTNEEFNGTSHEFRFMQLNREEQKDIRVVVHLAKFGQNGSRIDLILFLLL